MGHTKSGEFPNDGFVRGMGKGLNKRVWLTEKKEKGEKWVEKWGYNLNTPNVPSFSPAVSKSKWGPCKVNILNKTNIYIHTYVTHTHTPLSYISLWYLLHTQIYNIFTINILSTFLLCVVCICVYTHSFIRSLLSMCQNQVHTQLLHLLSTSHSSPSGLGGTWGWCHHLKKTQQEAHTLPVTRMHFCLVDLVAAILAP